MSGRVTMKDVAAQLGVSTATVSRALKDDPAISLATRQAVAEVAQRVQYRPSAAARRLRTKSTSLIGVVMQSVGDGYIGAVVLGIQSRARELGYQPLFFATEGRTDLESQALDVFLSEQVTQLITVSPSASVPRQAVAEGLHVAVINSDEAVPAKRIQSVATAKASPVGPTRSAGPEGRPPGTPRDPEPMIKHIAFDDLGAGRLATEHLIGLGHRNFVHLRGPNVRSSLLRLLGYRRALTEAGLWPQPVLTAPTPVMQSREAAVAEFLSKAAKRPVAMVAYDDMSAVAALHAAHRAGWRVPEDLSVVGIDDIQFAAYTNPGLTTVAQPKHRLGALAVDAVLEKDAAEVTVLDGELVIRESTSQPGGAT
ncbi:MAG TPA: LacI family DNA-binding transcriptional regulator [Streptosporangiaceae bacterium]|nr:LacI family DNA-binding transcriptional regulator [Streptosporangiaceae bacterium]